MRRRALVVQPRLRPLGGAEGITAWIVQALVPDHAVTLACLEPPDLPAVDRRVGTQLAEAGITIAVLRPPLGRVPLRLDNLRDWWFQRLARRLGSGFDVVIGGDSEADLGEGAVQYVHTAPKHVFRARGGLDIGWYRARGLAEAAYLEVSARLTGFDVLRMRRNPTLVVSDWVGEQVRRVHGIEATTLNPPAAVDVIDRPWEARTDTLVWAGRLWPDRRVELVIDIVERVRALGVPARLELLGAVHDPSYAETIRRLARERAFVSLREDVDRAELMAVMGTSRYGIHGTAEEAFGMAPAELVRAGAIVFVPDGGGQVDIVGRDARLLYRTAEEAAEKIAATMRSPRLQAELREHLAPLRDRFSSAHFVRGVRAACGLSDVS